MWGVKSHKRPIEKSRQIQTIFQKALALHQNQQLSQAKPLYRQILASNPRHEDSLHLLGMLEYQIGQPASAVELIQKAIALTPDAALYHSNLGVVFNSLGQADQAIESYRTAINLDPAHSDAHCNLAMLLAAQGKFSDAQAHFQKALTLNPDNPQSRLNYANALADAGDLETAIIQYQGAIALQPNYADAFSNLGNALQAQGKLEDAAVCYRHALCLEPQNLTTLYNFATNCQRLNRAGEAVEIYDRMLQLQPGDANALYGKSLAQLLAGDFANGWSNYESRFQINNAKPKASYPYPRWSHSSPGTVLVWGEQGIGDEIMFAGLLPDLIKTGTRCVVDCDPRLVPLFARSFPEIRVVSGFNPAEQADLKISAQIPAGSLPAVFRSTPESFAATTPSYLKPDSALRNHFRSRYASDKLLVGLAWHTRNAKTGRSRCIPLPLLAPLFQTEAPGVSWVSLQYGDHGELEKQCLNAKAPLFVDRTVDQLADMDRYAAQIAALDLVITIDNCTAHLAGALGVPAWVLLPCDRDWRWLQNRQDSPWYPTMQLLRQPTQGDWQSVIDRVAILLNMQVAVHRLRGISQSLLVETAEASSNPSHRAA